MVFIRMSALTLLCIACGPSEDAGVDSSCGIDCAAQKQYGLLVNRCFEYSSSNRNADMPPALGAWVRPVFKLEGDIATLPVEYRIGGQTQMIDYFAIMEGKLLSMRREFPKEGKSVTYRSDNRISGVQWLTKNSGVGDAYNTDAEAYLASATSGSGERTSYRIILTEAMPVELHTPLEKYTFGLRLVVDETPGHGSDVRRVYVPEVGFVFIASQLSLDSSARTQEFSLQKIRDVPQGSGMQGCSLGGD